MEYTHTGQPLDTQCKLHTLRSQRRAASRGMGVIALTGIALIVGATASTIWVGEVSKNSSLHNVSKPVSTWQMAPLTRQL